MDFGIKGWQAPTGDQFGSLPYKVGLSAPDDPLGGLGCERSTCLTRCMHNLHFLGGFELSLHSELRRRSMLM
jgi:hypothetical protein